MSDIEGWLSSIGLSEHGPAFAAQRIALEDVGRLSEADLKELGLPIGHRKKFLAGAADLLKARAFAADEIDGPVYHWQLTVVFCDVVNSTALSEQLEPEDLFELLRAYRAHCGKSINRYGGLIARFVGDGILAYFGHPTAHEDDAERAVRAALEITEGIGALNLGGNVALEVRIGIASGPVLVADIATAEAVDRQSAVGATPNLAARMQALAPPNGVVVADLTFNLLRGLFTFEDLGFRALSGFANPMRCWVVKGERPSVSRFAARQVGGRMAAFINREAELDAVMAAWSEALKGRGGTVMIHGEAGIGKSRFLDRFLRSVAAPGVFVHHYPTSAFEANTPLSCVKARLRDVAGILRDDDAETRLNKLKAAIVGDEETRRRILPIYAELFALPHQAADIAALSPMQLKQATFDALREQFRLLSATDAVILVVEDMHWLDPTTFELLELIRAEAPRRRALVVTTSREPPAETWRNDPATTCLELGRLSPADTISLVASMLGEADGSNLSLTIAERSDGFALYAEELARAALEDPQRLNDRKTLSVPSSLRQVLSARLDQAGSAKHLAQVAAVVGRVAPREMLAALSGLGEAEFERQAGALVRAGIFLADNAQGERRYQFTHALVQDAAYGSIVRDRRRQLHGRAAAHLIAQSPQIAAERPELLARHYDESGAVDEAVSCWLEAGRRAISRSSLIEANTHLRHGLSALRALPQTPLNKERQLEFMTLLGPASIALYGPGSSEAEEVYASAFKLCAGLPESKGHFAIYWGWWRVATDLVERKRRADALLRRAKARADDETLLQAHHCQWANQFFLGELDLCLSHVEEGLSIYVRGDYRGHASLYGNHDAKVCAHSERSLVYCMRCRPLSALAEEQKALAWARELGHSGSLAHAMDIALMHRFLIDDPAAALAHAEAVAQFGREKGLADLPGRALIFQGWAQARLGEPAAAAELLEWGLAQQREMSTLEDFPFFACMAVEARSLAGRHEDALAMLEDDLAFFRKTRLNTFMSEVHRWRGRLLRIVAPSAPERAEAAFQKALTTARAQGASELQLRAAVDLAALRMDLGASANEIARPIALALKKISEGIDTPLVARARSLLERAKAECVDTP